MPHDRITTIYTYDELSDEAKQRAVEQVAEKMAGPWWDSHDTEAVGEAILYTLAEKLGSPGWDTYGAGDFPGIDRVSIEGWDVDRGWSIEWRGVFTRTNAPDLPWVDGIEDVYRHGHHDYGMSYESEDSDPSGTGRDAIKQALSEAIHDALKAGRDEW